MRLLDHAVLGRNLKDVDNELPMIPDQGVDVLNHIEQPHVVTGAHIFVVRVPLDASRHIHQPGAGAVEARFSTRI